MLWVMLQADAAAAIVLDDGSHEAVLAGAGFQTRFGHHLFGSVHWRRRFLKHIIEKVVQEDFSSSFRQHPFWPVPH